MATATVLAGGAGSRLGGAKATALFAGRPLIEHVVAAARAGGLEPVVVAKARSPLPPLDCPVLIAATGPTRWTRTVTASCGLGLREARRSGRLVSVPVDRHLDVAGLTADPLPKLILAAGRRLAALVPAESPLASRAANIQEEHARAY